MKPMVKLLVGIAICFWLANSGTALAASTGIKGWVRADLPTAASYVPNRSYQYNSTGGTNSVTRLGVGQYRVDLPGLGGYGGIAHVSADGGAHQCKVKDKGPLSSAQQIYINCFNASGSPIDGRFTMLYYREEHNFFSSQRAYLWAEQPTVATYIPSFDYQWNSADYPNFVRRIAQGRYEARLQGLNLMGGTVLVTAYGDGPARCKVIGWGPSLSGSDTLVNVACFNPNGTAADAQYNLSYMMGVTVGAFNNEDQHYGGYAWANQPTSASYTPKATYQLNTAALAISAARLSTGSYRLRLPGLAPLNSTTALVTAYGDNSDYCSVAGWYSDGSGGTYLNITCFNTTATPIDTRFTILYLTDDQILF